MRCRSFLTLLACCALATSHAQFTEDFSDGDFAVGPAWSGSDALFMVVDDAGNQRLRSNSAGAANYHLSTPSTLVNDVQWEFFFDLRFSTSGANYVDVFLMSDLTDLSGAVNGYYLRCGGTADRLELFNSENGSGFSTGLLSPDGIINSSSSNPFRIKVTRTTGGAWTLFYDDGASGTYTNAGSITDNATTSATHFGIRIEQSSAATVPNKHFFDDLNVQAIEVDLTAPTVLSAMFTSAVDVDVQFSEPVEEVTAETVANYVISPGLVINSASRDGINASLVHLGLGTNMTNGTAYTVTATGVQDLAGNIGTASQGTFTYLVPVAAEFRDVVINELMADPTPVVGLPEAEFLELYNATTDRVFDLANWTISDGGTPVSFPTYTLGPGEYVVVMAAASLPLFSTVANKVGLASLPALNNDGDALSLRDASAVTIDNVTYALSWYQDGIKDDGGWTLEQIDPTSPCSGVGNWRASNAAAGGTPGTQNSIHAIVPDITAPALVSVQVPNANSLVLTFNEAMDAGNIAGGSYTITPAIGVGDAIATTTNSATLTLLDALVVGTIYTIVVEDVTDCPGNIIGATNTVRFALPEPIAEGDVVINEVLYDPIGSGSDFVELYNRSNKVLSLAGLQLASVSGGVVGTGLPITTSAVLLLPGEYALICEDELDVVRNYPQSHTDRFVVTDMPSYNNGEGSVVFLSSTGAVLDRFNYHDDLHFTLLNKAEGTSLERVDPDRPTDDNTNWHSAAQDIGKATPGYRNSQYAPAPTARGEMTIAPAIFSPDNDGHQDLLTIVYRFDQPGFVGTLKVFDIAGREVRTLWNNELLGTTGAVSWDGIMDSGSKARMGPYIVLLEAFDLSGNVEKYRQTVTLAHRLD